MTFADTVHGGGDALTLYQQTFTASGTVRGEVRHIVLNHSSAITVTFPAPAFGGTVYFITNESAVAHTLTLPNGVTWDGTNTSMAIAPNEKVAVVSASTDRFVVYRITPTLQVLTGATDAIAIPISHESVVVLARAGAADAATLAAPTAGSDDGKQLVVVAGTAQAHTVTQTTPGFNGAGAGGDVATFGGAIGDCMTLVAYNGNWLVKSLRNVTLA